MPSYDIVCDDIVCIIVNVCKQSLISGGGQLLGNDDGVKISCRKWFQVISSVR